MSIISAINICSRRRCASVLCQSTRIHTTRKEQTKYFGSDFRVNCSDWLTDWLWSQDRLRRRGLDAPSRAKRDRSSLLSFSCRASRSLSFSLQNNETVGTTNARFTNITRSILWFQLITNKLSQSTDNIRDSWCTRSITTLRRAKDDKVVRPQKDFNPFQLDNNRISQMKYF